MQNHLLDDQLIVRLDVRSPVPAERSIDITNELIARLRQMPDFSQSVFEILNLGRGSWWINLLIIGGGVGAIVQGAEGLRDDLRAGRSPFAVAISSALRDFGGRVCTIVTCESEAEVPLQEIPQPAAVKVNNVTHGNIATMPPESINQDDGWVTIKGRFVSALNGRFRVFRTGDREYRMTGFESQLSQIPTDEDVIVSARVTPSGVLQLSDWRPQGSDTSSPSSSDRALLQGSMIKTTNGTFFTARGGAVYRAEGKGEFLGNFSDCTILAVFTDRKDEEGHPIVQVARRLAPDL